LVLFICFIYPGCLYRFQYAFAAARAVVVEAFQPDDPVMQIDEAHRRRIDVGVLLEQRLGDGAHIGPFHGASPL